MLREKYFVRPPVAVYTSGQAADYAGQYSYANYNYLRPGLISRIKRARFEKALCLTEHLIGQKEVDAIDFGCADGVFLPSLSRYFRQVVGIDNSPKFIDLAARMAAELNLSNLTLLCNADTTFDDLRTQLPPGDYKLVYLLETLEHIGPRPCVGPELYEAKMEFLRGVFSLAADDAIMIISVPKMVGLPFLIKHMTQVALGMKREPLPLKELFKASILKNTDGLDPLWRGGHVGFNHLKLEQHLRRAFAVDRTVDSFTSVFYVVRQRST